MKKLIIEVRGGLVQAAFSDADDLSVVVVDWDNIKSDPDCPGAEPLELESMERLSLDTRALVAAV